MHKVGESRMSFNIFFHVSCGKNFSGNADIIEIHRGRESPCIWTVEELKRLFLVINGTTRCAR